MVTLNKNYKGFLDASNLENFLHKIVYLVVIKCWNLPNALLCLFLKLPQIPNSDAVVCMCENNYDTENNRHLPKDEQYVSQPSWSPDTIKQSFWFNEMPLEP